MLPTKMVLESHVGVNGQRLRYAESLVSIELEFVRYACN
jgi:hypothetical protein